MAIAALLLLAKMVTGVYTFAIYSDGKLSMVELSSNDLDQAIELAGITVGEDDKVVLNEDRSGEDFTVVDVMRAFEVKISADGKTRTVTTTGESVESLLRMAGVPRKTGDEINPGLEQMVLAASHIEVVRVDTRIEKVSEVIPFGTKTVQTEQLAKGKTKVVTEGQEGERVYTYEVTLKDGVEVSRELTANTVVREPVDRVVHEGIGGVVTVPNVGELSYSRYIDMRATAYTTENKTRIHTASGTVARVGAVAVDPKVIPLGTRLLIVARDGKSWSYGVAVAEDTGVRGNTIDLFFNTRRECINFGVRKARVYILD